MDACIDLMARALEATGRGGAVLPLRSMVAVPDGRGMIGLMPGYLDEPRGFGLKVVSIFPDNQRPGNHGTALDSHQGAVMLFDPEIGSPLAVVDAGSITAIRTAAVSGVATRALARDDAADLAILGSGVQAATHLAAMKHVRPGIAAGRIRVWSRDPAHARRFAEVQGRRHELAIEVAASARAAALGASLVCTTTAAREPILEGAWLAPGTHINAVGACVAAARELDAAAVARSRLVVDRRESALAEAGDFLLARREGAVGDDHIAGELGDVLLGRIPGRRSPAEITLFESLGIAVEDLAAARYLLDRAVATGAGVVVPFG